MGSDIANVRPPSGVVVNDLAEQAAEIKTKANNAAINKFVNSTNDTDAMLIESLKGVITKHTA